MSRYSVLLLALLVPRFGASDPSHLRPPTSSDAIIGRWDITLTTPDGPRPSWVEIWRSGREALVGQFVGIVGSARPVARIVASSDSLRFAIPPQWEEGTGDLVVEGRLDGERLVGRMTFPDGKQFDWTAARAPDLRRPGRPTWGAPINLLNPNDLRGWRAIQGENQWTVRDGILSNARSGANLVTDQTFGDFRLHIEFRYPERGNSGVYLRGRHEVQIEDNFGSDPDVHRFGAIYGFVAPSEMAARQAGTWQTFDITLVGRMVTVIANGRTIIFDREIPGITGGALDSDEGSPGPIMLQGDHGPIRFRNVTLTPYR
jgi:Domain of Unknown Function (DUF1080)